MHFARYQKSGRAERARAGPVMSPARPNRAQGQPDPIEPGLEVKVRASSRASGLKKWARLDIEPGGPGGPRAGSARRPSLVVEE